MTVFAQFNPAIPRLPWYEIEPWEAEVCAKWGGRQQVVLADVSGDAEMGITPFGDMTMTIQGRKVKTPTGDVLYETAYYLESFSATTSYKIEMTNPKIQAAKSIAEGTLAPGTGATDLVAEYFNETYTILRIVHDRGIMVVPIVEVK